MPYSEPWHITRGIFKSLSNMQDKSDWSSQNSFFKNSQGYLGSFKDIHAYSDTLTGVQLGGSGGGLLCSNLKSEKSVLILEKKRP